MLSLRATAAIVAAATITFAAAPRIQDAMQQMPQPTKQHRQIQRGAGEWVGTLTMKSPGMPTEPVEAKETVRKHGPFWVVTEFKCQFMGMPYMGHGCFGYDENKGEYVGTWLDSMSSHLSIMRGKHDEESGGIVMHWDAPDMTGKIVPHRSVQVQTEDAYTMTFYTDGKESMVIDMKRKPAEK